MKKNLLFATFLFVFGFQAVIAQDFITIWNTQQFDNSPPFIKFKATTVGTVSYTWQSLPPAIPSSGSGTFTGPNVNITGIPANTKIRLSIQPTNFKRFMVDNFSFFSSGIISVENWGSVAWTSMEDAFKSETDILINATDLPNLTIATSLKNMFNNCSNLNTPFNLNSWNISNITDISGMFSGCINFNQAISTWNTGNVTNMSGMFDGAREFNQNLGNWNTSNVTDMSKMFRDAIAFNRNIANWNTVNVINMSEMFAASAIFNFPMVFNQNIGGWNTSSVTNMSGMFRNAKNFNQNIGNWNTANVTNMSEMFQKANAFNQNIGNWNTTNVTDMSKMFSNDLFNLIEENYAFANGGNSSIQSWNTSNVVNMTGMFLRANSFNYNLGSWSLKPNVILLNMLDRCGLNCSNYSATIIGWSSNPTTPNNKVLGATFMEYGPQAVAAVNNLVVNKGWGFSGHDLLNLTPTFQPSNTYCSGSNIPALPLISENNISGTWSPTINNTATTLYTFTPNPNQCSAATATLSIPVTPRPTVTGNSTQTLNQNATVGSIVVAPSNVVWYATLANALAATNAIPNTNTIVAGNYFGVTTSGNCSSLPFLVSVTIALSNDAFDTSNLKYYPNPTNSVLNLSYSQAITNIEITSILGQKVITKKTNNKEVQLDISELTFGTYFVKIKAGDSEKVIKISKK